METYLLFMRDKNDKEFIFDHRHYKFYNYDEYSSLNPRSYVVSNKSIDDLILSFSCSIQGINIYSNLTPFSKMCIEVTQLSTSSYIMDISELVSLASDQFDEEETKRIIRFGFDSGQVTTDVNFKITSGNTK